MAKPITFLDRPVEWELTPGDDETMIIEKAYFLDGDERLLTEDEMIELESLYDDRMAEAYFDHCIMRAEAAYEGDR